MSDKTLKLAVLAAIAYFVMKQMANKKADEMKGGI
jgi:hypothetical protein